MNNTLRSIWRLCALSLLGIAGCALLPPAAAWAGGSPAPAAISFNLNVQATVPGTPLNATANGVANQNGDLQATIAYEGHTFGLISTGGVQYQNEDGGAYQVSGGTTAASAGRQAAVPLDPACLQAQTSLSTLFEQALSGQGAGTALGLQDLGPVMVGDQQAEHLQGSVDLDRALLSPPSMQALSPLLGNCSPGGQQAMAFLPLVLSGSGMNIDADVDPSTGVPLQFDLNLTVPLIGANVDLSGQMTPLAGPAAITAPS